MTAEVKDRRVVHPLRSVWLNLHARCSNPKASGYKHYGGRGIRVCAEWKSFDQFCIDMGERPEGYTIERVDNDGPYSKANCIWAPATAQGRNKRTTKLVEFEGREWRIGEVADRFGLTKELVASRIRAGWTVAQAVSKPAPFPFHLVWQKPYSGMPRMEAIAAIRAKVEEERQERFARYAAYQKFKAAVPQFSIEANAPDSVQDPKGNTIAKFFGQDAALHAADYIAWMNSRASITPSPDLVAEKQGAA